MKSPVPFNKQAKRDPITKGTNLSEERFNVFNGMPSVVSKYKNSPESDFSKTVKGDMMEFLMTSGVVGDNANNQSYEPNYDYQFRSLAVGIPNFDRFVSREKCE